jgi:hypothetical protein
VSARMNRKIAGMIMVDMNPASVYLLNLASGTSVNAAAWPMPMLIDGEPFDAIGDDRGRMSEMGWCPRRSDLTLQYRMFTTAKNL